MRESSRRILCCNGSQGRAEEAQNEDCSSYRSAHSTDVRGRAADRAGRCCTNSKVRGVLQQLVREARQGAGRLRNARLFGTLFLIRKKQIYALS